jgi:phage shock protein C
MSSTDMRQDPVGQVSDPPPAPPLPQAPVLRRSRDDRVVFGVAGGLGRYLGVDPVIIRIGLVLLTVFGGSGVLLYLIGLVVIPDQAEGEVPATVVRTGAGGQNAVFVLGAVLVVLGSLSLVTRLVPGLSNLIGPALLIGVGALVITMGGRR